MRDTMLPVASLFHANGWGIPFTAAMAGAKVVLPGPFADAEGLLDLMEQERVTMTTRRATVWFGVLEALDKFPGRWKFAWPVRMLRGRGGRLGSADARFRPARDYRHLLVGHDGNDSGGEQIRYCARTWMAGAMTGKFRSA